MVENTLNSTSETVASGHIAIHDDMTSATPEETTALSPLNLFILLDHEFIISLSSGKCNDVAPAYTHFTRDVVTLYHGNYNKEEIRSALHIVEDHLTVILEDIVELAGAARKFLMRAINFIRMYAAHIAKWCRKAFNNAVSENPATEKVAETNKSASESKEGNTETYQWTGAFTEVVELLDALIGSGRFESMVQSRFIRSMFRVFGITKSVNDYHRALNKLHEKAPKNDEGTGRCKLLVSLLDSTENRWRDIYDGK